MIMYERKGENMENIEKFDLNKEMQENLKVKKEYSIEGKLTKWKGNTATGEGKIETLIIDDTSKLSDWIINTCAKSGVNIDAIMTYIKGNSHDEDDVTDYFILGSNYLWGKMIEVGRDLYTETNVYCYGSKRMIGVKDAVKYFVTFQNDHFIISPVILGDAYILHDTIIKQDSIEIYGENEEKVENFAKILGII